MTFEKFSNIVISKDFWGNSFKYTDKNIRVLVDRYNKIYTLRNHLFYIGISKILQKDFRNEL